MDLRFIILTLIIHVCLGQQQPNEGAQLAVGLANALINTIFPQLNLNQNGNQNFVRQQPSFSGIPVLSAPRSELAQPSILDDQRGTFGLHSFSGGAPLGNDLFGASPVFQPLSQLSGSLLQPSAVAPPGIGVGSSLRSPGAPSTGNLLEDVSRVGILPALINLARPALSARNTSPAPPSPSLASLVTDQPAPIEKITRRPKPAIVSAPGGIVPQEQSTQNLIDPSSIGSPFLITSPNVTDLRLRSALLVGQPQGSAGFVQQQPPPGWPFPQSGLVPAALPPQQVLWPQVQALPQVQQPSLSQLLLAQGLPQGFPQQPLVLPVQQAQLQAFPAAAIPKSRLITSNGDGGENYGSDCPQCIPIDLARLSGPWVQVYGNPQALKTIYTSIAHLESLYGDDSVQSTDFSVIQPSCVGIQFSKPQRQGHRSESTMNVFFRDDSGTKQLHEAAGRVKQDLDANPHGVNFKLPAFDLPMCLVKSGPETSTMYGYVILAETIGTNRCRSYHVFTRQADTFFRDYNADVAAFLKQQVDENSVKPVGVLPFPDLCQLQNIAKVS